MRGWMAAAAFAAMALAPALAGCAGGGPAERPAAGGLEMGTATPGEWHIGSPVDHLLAWVRNTGDAERQAAWSMTGAGGSPLPEGWAVTFTRPEATLAPAGAKETGPDGVVTYPDWAWTRVTVVVPPQGPPGPVAAELHAGGATLPVLVTVAERFGRVASPGDTVIANLTGSLAPDGEVFQPEGPAAPVRVGLGIGAPALDEGLLGLGPGERVRLVIPPGIGPGYDQPAGSAGERFNGRTLWIDVRVERVV